MEGTNGEKKMPPALAVRRTSKIEQKLSMTSPNNSRSLLETSFVVDTSRPRSRSGRRRSSTYNRRRSLEGIDHSSAWLAAQSLQASHFDSSNLDESNESLEKVDSKSPNNSNHSFNKSDALRSTVSPRPTRGRPSQSNNQKLFSRRSSFDLSFLQAQTAMQKNKKTTLEAKLGMSSPNNNFSRLDSQRAVAAPRPRSRSGRPRNRRRSTNVMANSFIMPTPEINEGDSDNLEIKKDSNSLSAKTPGYRQCKARGGMSLQSTSAHSGYSCYTEMTIHTDYLLKNQEDDSASTSSRAYSDGDIYDSNLHYSIAINDDEYDYFEDTDDEDDSSNPDFNYEARDNGSLRTLSSAFTLDDLGSNATVSTLSVDLEDDDDDDYNETEVDKRLQFLFAPNFNARRSQRPSRRSSYHSVGRRRRRHSNDSMLKSDDYDEVTAEEDEELTLDGSMPSMPNLPNQISADVCFRSVNEMTDNMEEVTVDEEMDDEYIEEVLLNDNLNSNDNSSKRYDILIEEESYEEEIIVDMEDEELTLEYDDIEYDDLDDAERCADDRNGRNNSDLSKAVEKTESSANDHNNNESKTSTLGIDVKEVSSDCQRDYKIRDDPQNIDETKINSNCQGGGNNTDDPSSLDKKTEVRANGISDDNTKHSPSNANEEKELSVNKKDSPPDTDNKAELNLDQLTKIDANCENNGNNKDDPSNHDKKTKVRANGSTDDNAKYRPLDTNEEKELSVNKKDSAPDTDNKADLSLDQLTKIDANCQGDGNNIDNPSNLDKKTEVRVNGSIDGNTKYSPSDISKEKEPSVNKIDSSPDTDNKPELNLDHPSSGDNKCFSPNIDARAENNAQYQLYNGETDCRTEKVEEDDPLNVGEKLDCSSENGKKAASLNNKKDSEGSSDSNDKTDHPTSGNKIECTPSHLSNGNKKSIALNLDEDMLENRTDYQNDENEKNTSPNMDEKLNSTSVDPIDDNNCDRAMSYRDILLGS